ncbi:ABC transporter permease/M1 family aminopeptidase [Neolewinella persica]|uniref:ABC transporter permease/M1 family aminopeptidase n=1 Tax=Neolewinella persica TaxID=70998 RepID=UPI000373484B|nr:M1 family aminopeptidase [Neolewinella persica]
MLYDLLRFEFGYQLRQRYVWLFMLLFLSLGLLVGRQDQVGVNIVFNGSYQMSFILGLFSLSTVFIVMFATGNGLHRDQQYKFEEILFSSGLKKWQFYWVRYIGVLGTSALAFGPLVIGLILGQCFADVAPERYGPWTWGNYLKPWCWLVLPNILICSSLIFVVSLLFRNTFAAYATAVLIYAGYWLGAIFLNSPLLAQGVPTSPENMAIAAIASPFGLAAFFEQTQYWTPTEHSFRQLAFTGYLAWNRVLWFGISIAVLLFGYFRFSLRPEVGRGKNRQGQPSKAFALRPRREVRPDSSDQRRLSGNLRPDHPADEPAPIVASRPPSDLPTPFPIVTKTFGVYHEWRAFLRNLSRELRFVFGHLAFLGIFATWLFIVISEVHSHLRIRGDYGEVLYPYLAALIEQFAGVLPYFSLILIVFYGGELVWRERTLRISDIMDAMPVSNAAIYLAKLAALTILPLVLLSSGLLVCLGYQLGYGGVSISPISYLLVFYLLAGRLLFFATLTIMLQSLATNKYLGMLLSLVLCLVLATPLSVRLGLEHPLWRPGDLTQVQFNDMSGFGVELGAYHLRVALVVFLGGFFSLIGFRAWKRGTDENLASRLIRPRPGSSRFERLLSALALIGTAGCIFAIFYQVNMVEPYINASRSTDLSEEYERRFKQYDQLQKLYPVDLNYTIDLFPEERQYSVTARHILKNKGNSPVDKVFLSARLALQEVRLSGGHLLSHDNKHLTYLYQFDTPLQPGDSTTLNYSLEVESTAFNPRLDIANNGTYILPARFEPSMGYRPSREIRNDRERERRGLPPRGEELISSDHFALPTETGLGRVNFECLISTSATQTALAPGTLQKEWTENGRYFAHFKAQEKVVPFLAFFSADYEVRREIYQGITIEHYFHAEHDMNIDASVLAVKRALDYGQEQFGPYPYDYLRIAEIPGHYRFGGMAMPGLISMVSNRYYLVDQRNTTAFNLVAKRAIHEVGHQWWGHALMSKPSPGSGLLIEGLAKYTEGVVMDKYYGKGSLWNLSDQAQRRYFRERAYDPAPEQPLLLGDAPHLLYGKSYPALMATRDLLGEQRINALLRELIGKEKGQTEFTVTSLDLINGLKEMANPEEEKLLEQWLERIIIYDIALETVALRKEEDGFLIQGRFKAHKRSNDAEEISCEPLPLGVFTVPPGEVRDTSQILHWGYYSPGAPFELRVTERPFYLSIDPYGTRVEEKRHENTVGLELIEETE